jgi:hypothetical protein
MIGSALTQPVKRAIAMAVAAAVLASVAVLVWRTTRREGAAGFEPGRWEVTVTLAGRTDAAAGPFVDTQCLTREEPAPRAHLPPGCRTYGGHLEGDQLSWRVRCSAPQGDGLGKVTVTGDRFEGTMSMWLTEVQTGAPRRMRQDLRGHRLGDCD